MSIEDFQIRVNDSLPSIEYTVTRSGSGSTTPNLEGFTANFKVRQQGTTSNSFTLAVTSSGGDDGQITSIGSSSSGAAAKLEFNFSTGRFNSSGTFFSEISLINASDKVESAPDLQSIIIRGEF